MRGGYILYSKEIVVYLQLPTSCWSYCVDSNSRSLDVTDCDIWRMNELAEHHKIEKSIRILQPKTLNSNIFPTYSGKGCGTLACICRNTSSIFEETKGFEIFYGTGPHNEQSKPPFLRFSFILNSSCVWAGLFHLKYVHYVHWHGAQHLCCFGCTSSYVYYVN